MTRCEKFLEYFDYLVANCKEPVELPGEVREFYDFLKQENASEVKSLFTETGIQILEYLQNIKGKNLKAKDIADGMGVSSRKITGAIRKLVTDGFVEKFGKDPVIYSLTNKGQEFNIQDYKERLVSTD